MNLKNKKSVKKIIVSILALFVVLFISKVSLADYWTSGETGDTQISNQLHKNSSGTNITKNVSQLSKGDVFWITGNGSSKEDQVFRSRAVFCTERENSLTQAQNGKYIKYKIMSVNRINTFSSHTPAEKGLAYIASFKRNGGGDFGNYSSAQTDEPVQNAFWTYSSQNKSNIHIFGDRIGKEGKEVGNSKEIVNYANGYRDFVNGGITTSAKISNVKAEWNSDYTKLIISYNLDYKYNNPFGKVTNVTIGYNGHTVSGTGNKGNNSVSIDINTIPNDGCEFTINVTYTYTYVESIICDFSNPDYKGQNLAIVSGARREVNNASSAKGRIPTKTTNVSMQKYITKVTDGKGVETKYTLRNNKYAESDAGLDVQGKYIHQNSKDGKISKNNISEGKIDWKKTSYVEIEAGDTVEYTIEVYNNGSVPTEVVLNDRIISTAKIEKVLKDGQEVSFREYNVTDEYKYYNLYTNEDNNRRYFELAGGKSTTFKVYVKYSAYSKTLIMNKAWIDSSPLNNTEYRTIDADYVKMKEYKVSLEKWVSSVGKSEIPSVNVADKFIDKKYPYLIEYLKNNTNIDISDLKTLSDGLNQSKLQYIINNKGLIDSSDIEYSKADLNGDEKVDATDLNILRTYEVYKKLGNDAQNIIRNYIDADLDNDYKVTSKDFEIYKVLRANLYKKPEKIMQYVEGPDNIERNIEEQVLNEKDIHMFILKSMHANNNFNNDGLNYLKLKRLLKDKTFEETKTEAKRVIEEHIKSDINDDGIVNEEDAYVIYNGYLIINYNSDFQEDMKIYYLKPITEEIDNLSEEEVNNLYEEYIKKYDLNNDLAINENDINLLDEYNNRYNDGTRYNSIAQWESRNQNENLLENIKNYLVIKNNDINYDSAYDIDGDGDIDVDDIKLSFQFDDEEFKEFKQEIKNILTINNKDYDANGDEKLSYEDYELAEEYQVIKSKIGEENISTDILKETIEKYNIFNEDSYNYEGDSELIDFSEKDIYAIKIYKGLKEYNENLKDFDISFYDFDENDQLDINDISKINEAKDLNINLDNLNINSFIETFIEASEEGLKDLNTDLNDSNTDKSILGDKVDYDLLREIIQDITINNKEILQNEGLYKDVKKSNYNYYDINNGIIKYSNEGLYSYLDANEDGIINEEDITYLNENYKELNSVEVSKENIESIIAKDTNGDGAFDQTDKKIIEECKTEVDSQEKRYDFNKDGKYDEADLNLLLDVKKLNRNDEVAIEEYLKNNNGSSTEQKPDDREGKAEYLTEVNGELIDNTHKDSQWTQHNTYKYNNVVSVENGDFVTYTIKVTNDGNTDVYISEIVDNLPESGVNYTLKVEGIIYDRENKQVTSTELENVLLKAKTKDGEKSSATITITVKVTESNMSTEVLKNTAKITQITNKNGVMMNADECDSTPYNNKDSDYIQLRDIEISGFVWNDRATNKEQNNYNLLYEDNKDKMLDEKITVYLYQVSENGQHVAYSTTTNAEGKYTFNSQTIKSPIKGPKLPNTKPWKWGDNNYTSRWDAGKHYSYYIIFEYDGIKYTSTPDGKRCVSITDETAFNNGNYKINSNAKEDNGPVKETRKEFNNRFSTINNNGAYNEKEEKTTDISYTTKNEKGYIPQSNHEYNAKMAMQSSTDFIQLSSYKNNPNLEKQLQHVDLGLRGRDIFDLELTSDVYSTRISVNGQTGEYNYGNNKVTVNKSDIGVIEDFANFASEKREATITDVGQTLRDTDLDVNIANKNTVKENRYKDTGLGIEVTYKITVTNASQTAGTASKIVDYYDSRYSIVNVYSENKDLGYAKGNSGNGYKSIIITTPQTPLTSDNRTMEIYVVLTLTNATDALEGLLSGTEKIPTYNMAEIYEYKTYTTNNNEATRGLLDKDSVPGSSETEKARLASGTTQDTTVEYYFKAQKLSNLKYEDDTYATPTLYYQKTGEGRQITGTVFEDYTRIINNDNNNNFVRTKTGDGKQTGDEPGIEGAIVELVEVNERFSKAPKDIQEDDGIIRYSTTTNKNGKYAFTGFLPGNYIIRYKYGNTVKTFTYNNDPNTKSYNGEDFQSTNNIGAYEAGILNNTKNLWYAYNENDKVSTGTDNSGRRKDVSTDVTNFTDEEMTVLNNVRDGKSMTDANVTYIENEETKTVEASSIMNRTEMFATTPVMLLTVEETVQNGNDTKQNKTFTDYVVSNMDFGIAEVPVTTIDLQKHVYALSIKDSTGNTLAEVQKNTKNSSIVVNASKISANRLDTVVNVLADSLKGLDENQVKELINYENNKNLDYNIPIKENLTKEEIEKLQNNMTQYSLTREINIIYAWNVTSGSVLAAPGTPVIDISIEDEKLQGAKLEVTYEITASIYAEKNFNNDEIVKPSIKGIADFIDNDLSYNEELIANGQRNNYYWNIAKQEDISNFFKAESLNNKDDRLGTLDPEGKKYTTVLTANKVEEGLLLEDCGIGSAYITLEKVLSASDSSIMDIITSSIDTYEYENQVEITGINYGNTTEENTGKFIYRDRVRTADRYIILAGKQHDSAASEIIAIHPPTGENRSMNYFILAVISLGVLAIGIFEIRKFVIKRK